MRVLVISPGSRPSVLAVALEHAEQVLDALDVAEQVRPVGVLGDEPQRLALARAADQDRDVAADRLRVVERAVDAVVLALVGRRRPAVNSSAGDVQRVLEALEALLQRREVEPVRLVLLLEPGRADAEHGTAAGDDVDRRRELGQQRRVAVGDAADQQAEVDRRRPRGERGEDRVALHHPVLRRADRRDLVEVVHHRDRAEAGAPRRSWRSRRACSKNASGGDVRPVEVRDVQVQLKRCAHGGSHATPRMLHERARGGG